MPQAPRAKKSEFDIYPNVHSVSHFCIAQGGSPYISVAYKEEGARASIATRESSVGGDATPENLPAHQSRPIDHR